VHVLSSASSLQNDGHISLLVKLPGSLEYSFCVVRVRTMIYVEDTQVRFDFLGRCMLIVGAHGDNFVPAPDYGTVVTVYR
jgi:hypothetical protein